MAEYKTIKGFKVQSYATDPAADQWAAATWTAGGAISRATRAPGGGGTNTAGLMVGGTAAPNGAPAQTGTEEYNGSTWASGNACNNGMWGMASCGSQTAFNKFAGYSGTARSVASEEYDGTSWTTITNYPQTTSDCHGCGTQTASLIFGGLTGGSPYSMPSFLNETNSWTGSAYVSEGSMNTRRYLHGGTGTETAGLCVAGQNFPPGTKIKNVEEYNGTSWTEVNDIPTTTSSMTAGGTQTAGIYAGGETTGNPDVAAVTAYSYDGTSWTSIADMPAGKYQPGATKQAANTDMVLFGGTTGPGVDTTTLTTFHLSAPTSFRTINEGQIWYNTTGNALKYTVNLGAWASGNSMNTARFGMGDSGSTGTVTATLCFGGDVMPTEPRMVGNTEDYDGTSWSEKNNLNTTRGQPSGTGTTTAGLCFGGEGPPPSHSKLNAVEKWDGTSWTAATALSTAKYALGGAGIQTASIAFGGYDGSHLDTTESWNGSSWTEVNDLNTARSSFGGAGEFTNALAVGGNPASTTSESWDGTSWTTITAMTTARSNCGVTGNGSLGLVFGGSVPGSPGFTAATEYWDGTSWTEFNDMGSARNNMGEGGTTTATVLGGGYDNPTINGSTEIWTYADAVKTVTVS